MDDQTCAYCHKLIPEEVIKARHYSPARLPAFVCCSREHSVLYRQQTGMYKQMSQMGKSARSAAVTVSNHLHPRRTHK